MTDIADIITIIVLLGVLYSLMTILDGVLYVRRRNITERSKRD